MLDDFLVMKMDVAGAEWQIIPKLVSQGTWELIDELWLECHYYKGTHVPTVHSVLWSHCFRMYQNLRELGMYVHEWR